MKGVGCGSVLWPVLTRLNQIDGVSRSFSNWTGSRLRISVAPGADRSAVAERVRQVLAAQDRQPKPMGGTQLSKALHGEDWYGAAHLVDLSSYEFRTIAKRRIAAFADAERLGAAQREKLIRLADRLWDKSAEGIDLPGPAPEAYRRYWRGRLGRFVHAYVEQARQVVTPRQAEGLSRLYPVQAGSTTQVDRN